MGLQRTLVRVQPGRPTVVNGLNYSGKKELRFQGAGDLRHVGIFDALEERFYRLLSNLLAENTNHGWDGIKMIPGTDIFPAGDKEQILHWNNPALPISSSLRTHPLVTINSFFSTKMTQCAGWYLSL